MFYLSINRCYSHYHPVMYYCYTGRKLGCYGKLDFLGKRNV